MVRAELALNDEARNNDEIRMTKKAAGGLRHSNIRASFVIRHSSFVISERQLRFTSQSSSSSFGISFRNRDGLWNMSPNPAFNRMCG